MQYFLSFILSHSCKHKPRQHESIRYWLVLLRIGSSAQDCFTCDYYDTCINIHTVSVVWAPSDKLQPVKPGAVYVRRARVSSDRDAG